MGFVWPLMAASAEAMIFLWVLVVLVIIGRGKLLPSEKQIVIERGGKYKMSLAPGLNLAQPFIEAVANKIISTEKHTIDSEFGFKVHDKKLATRKQPFYILNVSSQSDRLYFEAKTTTPETMHHEVKLCEPVNAGTLINPAESEIYSVAKLWSVEMVRIK
jgi:hypothetical protein